MKVIKKYNQSRRDCFADLKCEGCEAEEVNTSAYDDRNYWDNVIPQVKCRMCGKSTNDFGIKNEIVQTRYSANEVV